MRMLRAIRKVGVLITLVSLLSALPVRAIDTTPAPERLPNSPLLVTAYYLDDGDTTSTTTNGNTPRYFEVHNNSDSLVDAREWTLNITWSHKVSGSSDPVSSPLSLQLASAEQYITPKSHVVMSFGDAVTGASRMVDSVTGEVNNYISDIRLIHPDYKPYSKTFTAPQTNPMYLNETTTGYTTTGTYSTDARGTLYDNGFYELGVSAPLDFNLSPIEILANPRNCSPLETDISCREYVKFYNSTSSPVDFSGTRLRIGVLGQSGTTVPLSGIIQPGEYTVFDHTETGGVIAITNSGGYVWLEDTYGIKLYENTVTSYANASSTTRKGQSWALLDGTWQWASPNPSGPNTPLPVEAPSSKTTTDLKACRSNQYRNPETNRCRLIASASSTLTPCAANQYRNPETNRCRLISSSSSSLTPCKPTQYRNPATNRCKSIASTASNLKPCNENQERNPATNRCRNKTSSIKADFPVQPIAETSQATIGWWAFGGVGTLAAGYAGWEWRRELSVAIKKIATFFTSSK